MNKKNIILIFTILILIAALFIVLEKEVVDSNKDSEFIEDELPKNIVGEKAPNFILENLQGEKISLEDKNKDIVFITFWSSSCEECRDGLDNFQKVLDEREDIRVLGVNVREEKDEVKNFIENNNYNFEILLDETGEIGLDYVISRLPTTYVVDRDNTVIKSFTGIVDYDQIVQILDGPAKK